MSLDRVQLSLDGSFGFAQGCLFSISLNAAVYVGLSRARSLDGLTIEPSNDLNFADAIRANPRFRKSSASSCV
jgi:hypothetical protein